MRAWCAVLVWLWAASASAQTYTIGVFPGTATDAAPGAPIAQHVYLGGRVTCGQGQTVAPVPVNGVPVVAWWDDPAVVGRACYVSVVQQMQALPAGTYRAAVAHGTGAWSLLSQAFTVAPAPVPPPPSPPTCMDGSVTYAPGEGPTVAILPNGTVANRAAWAARVKALRAAGFQVDVLLNSTSVYLHATCAQ